MPFSLTMPIWLVALVVAAVAPWAVRAMSDAIDREARRRTAALLARAAAVRAGGRASKRSQNEHEGAAGGDG